MRTALVSTLLALASWAGIAEAQLVAESFQVLAPLDAVWDVGTPDLDGDGAPEVVVIEDHSYVVSIFWNDGLGWFGARTTVSLGTFLYWVVSGDLDRDGDQDVVIGGASGVFVLVSEGERSLSVHGPFFAGPYLSKPEILDFDRDGWLDLVGPNGTFATMTIVRGTGTGDFVRGETRPLPAPADALWLRDVDGDGILDVLAFTTSFSAPQRFNVVSGKTGVTMQTLSFRAGYGRMLVDDFDSNGFVDLAVSHDSASVVTIASGSASGTFTVVGEVAVPQFAHSLAAADFDGDGRRDLAATHGAQYTDFRGPTILLGDGQLGFMVARRLSSGSGAFEPRVADLNGDGRPDLVVPHVGTGDVAILLNEGDARFSSPLLGPALGRNGTIVSGDVDADGHADLLAVSGWDRRLDVVRGDGRGGFTPAGSSADVGVPRALAAGDLDGDGRLDVAIVDVFDTSVLIGRGDGAGTFSFSRTRRFADEYQGFRDVLLVDVDADADLDVVAAGAGNRQIWAGVVLLNDGAGVFSEAVYVGPDRNVGAAAAGDLDGDGRIDLVFSAAGDAFVFVARQDAGPGTSFSFDQALSLGIVPKDVELSDTNGDGVLDVLVAGPGGLSVCLGVGDGTFLPREAYGPPSAERLLAADFEGDGDPDVGLVGRRVDLLDGTGGGRFVWSARYGAVGDVFSAALGDFDEDGRVDVAVASDAVEPDRRLSILLGRDRAIETCRRGNVNAARGPIADVLYVNDSVGGFERRVEMERSGPLSVFVANVPDPDGPGFFALYAWLGEPRRSDARWQPFGIGVTAFATPLSGGEPRPRAIWNNVPRSEASLGGPRFPSSPAPSLVLARPRGPRRPVVFYLQGIIADRGSINGRASVTNGVVVDVK